MSVLSSTMAKRALPTPSVASSKCDASDLAPLAKRVPAVKPTGNAPTDGQLQAERKAMVQIIDAVCKQPKIIMPLFGYMTSSDFDASEDREKKGAEFWKGGYKQIERIPKGWISECRPWSHLRTWCVL